MSGNFIGTGRGKKNSSASRIQSKRTFKKTMTKKVKLLLSKKKLKGILTNEQKKLLKGQGTKSKKEMIRVLQLTVKMGRDVELAIGSGGGGFQSLHYSFIHSFHCPADCLSAASTVGSLPSNPTDTYIQPSIIVRLDSTSRDSTRSSPRMLSTSARR